MPNEIPRSDIYRLWLQVVTEMGVDAYSSDQWQKIYEDFWKCMTSDAKPFTKIDTLPQLKLGNLRTKAVYMSDIIANRSQVKDGPRNLKGHQPQQTYEPMIDKFNEEWRLQRDVSSSAHEREQSMSRRVQGVPYRRPNSVQRQQQQWNRPQQQNVAYTQHQQQQQQQQQQRQQQQQQQRQQQFRIPKVAQQQQHQQQHPQKHQYQQQHKQQFKAQTPRMHTEVPYARPQPQVPNRKIPFEEAISYQEKYERNQFKKPLGVQNINADVPKINAQPRQSLRERYEQSRMRQPLSVPNINADVPKINAQHQSLQEKSSTVNKPKTEVNLSMKNQLPIANSMVSIVNGKSGENNQEAQKMSAAEGNNKIESIDDWLQNFPDETANEHEQRYDDTIDFFKNLPATNTVIGSTSHDLTAFFNTLESNSPPAPKKSKKSKKKRNKNKE